MRQPARPDLWEAWVGDRPGPPGSLSAAPGKMEAPPRAPHGEVEGRTGSQLIRGVLRTLR
jgi:hypothetical protein